MVDSAVLDTVALQLKLPVCDSAIGRSRQMKCSDYARRPDLKMCPGFASALALIGSRTATQHALAVPTCRCTSSVRLCSRSIRTALNRQYLSRQSQTASSGAWTLQIADASTRKSSKRLLPSTASGVLRADESAVRSTLTLDTAAAPLVTSA